MFQIPQGQSSNSSTSRNHQNNDLQAERIREPLVSSFEPHHVINFEYPHTCLREDESERMVMLPLTDDSKTEFRYEPVDLVSDPAVAAHASRENEAETSYYSLTRAHRSLPPHLAHDYTAAADFKLSLTQLITAMNTATTYIGETLLQLFTFKVPDDGRIWVRVRRNTTYQREGGGMVTREERFEFRLEAFRYNHNHVYPRQAAWLMQMRELISRETDRAFMHARLWMLEHDWDDTDDHGFRAPRGDKFDRLLSTKVSPADPHKLEDEPTCCICTDEFGVPGAPRPVSLPCNASHVLCEECLTTWVTNTGVRAASCPRCRQKIFEEHEVDGLAFGLINGVCEYDRRYGDWENFERSCADIDRELAEDSDNPITVDSSVFSRAWIAICDGLVLESEGCDEVLQDLNPLCFPEWDIVHWQVLNQISEHDGQTISARALFNRILRAIYEGFRTEFYNGGLDHYMSRREKKRMSKNVVKEPLLNVRGGLQECLKRCLNRMIRFVELRQCQCSAGFHKHGVRVYYNPQDLEDVITAPEAETELASKWRRGSDVEMTDVF